MSYVSAMRVSTLGDADMAEIVRDNRADLMAKIRAQVDEEGGNLGIAAVPENPSRPICHTRFRQKSLAGCRANARARLRNIALKAPKPRERSPPQPTAMSSYFVATRSAKLIRRGTKAMRKETAFCRGLW
jgi:hypothetical protein